MKMTLEELLTCFSMRAIKGKNWEDVREKILSWFAEQDKMIELMARRIYQRQEVASHTKPEKLTAIQRITLHYRNLAKQLLKGEVNDRHKENDN